jgi:hypothetical protein
MNNGIIRHINPRDMILENLKKAYLKEHPVSLVDRILGYLNNLTDHQLCQLYSEKYETNPKYIAEQFEFKF